MADRTVVARLVLNVAGYTPAAVEASKSTSALATAQKEAEASAKAAGIAARDAGFAARDAAAQASAAAAAQSAAMKEATAAAKEASAAQVTAAKATTEAERVEAEAAAQVAAERAVQAKEALTQASEQAEATAQAAAAAKAGSLEAAKYAASQRDVATAAREAAASEAAATKETEAAAAQRTKAYKESGAAMGTMALATGAAIGLMVKDAGDFQSSTQHLVTDAGESQDKLAMIQAGILKTASATGTSATQLVDAMYHIESAGFHGQAGLDMLTTSAEGAKVGAADLGTVAKTLTGTMNSYSESGYSNVQMMNMLIATTAAGDMKMNDLAGSLGNVTPVAAAAKISFAEVGGAIATMTSQNMSADRATQDLAHTINSLQNPSQVQIAQMQQLGLDSNDVSENLGKRGLTGTLEMLTTAVLQHTQGGEVFIDSLKSSKNAAADADAMLKELPASVQGLSKELLNGSITAAEYKKGIANLDAPQQHMAQQFEQLVKSSGGFNDLLKKGGPAAETYNAAMAKLLGGATGLNTALMLTGGRMQVFKDNAAAVQNAANKGGTEVDNWGKIQQTFNQKVDVAKASLGAMGIAIGSTLLPVVSDLAKWITDIVTPITEWVDHNKGLTEGILATAAGAAVLILAIKGIAATQSLLTKAFEGINTAVTFFTKNAEAAAAKAEAMGAANAAAATETEAASVSTATWATKLGGSIPVLGAVAVGAAALGTELNKVTGGTDKAWASVDQLTAALTTGSGVLQGVGDNADQTQRMMASVGAKADAAIEPAAALGVALAKTGQMMGHGAEMAKNYDGALAAMVSGGQADRAAQLMAEITSATDKQGKALINTQADFPQYWAAVDKATANQALAAGATKDSTAALGANAAALGANAAAASGATDATGALADAAGNATSAADAETVTAKAVALQLFQAAAASRSLTEAQAAEAGSTDDAAAAHTSAKGAAAGNAAATKDAAAAAKAHDAATKADTTSQKDAAKAAKDKAKADADAKAAADSAATAESLNGAVNSTAAERKKANAKAASDATKATNAQTTADNAASRASDAASRAADKHTTANEKSAKAASAAADAAAKQAKASGQDQAAQDAAAESAREAALVHETGAKWLQAVADAEGQASDGAEQLDQSVLDEIGAMKDAKTAASNLKDGMDALNGVHIAASKAAIDVQQKVADLTKALHDNGKTLDITTDAGRKNMTAIDDLASAASAHAQSVAEETGSIQAGNKALDASREQFDAVLKSAGFSTQQIDAFNKSILQTPKLDAVTLQVTADTSAAAAALQKLENQYGGTGIAFGGGPSGKRIVPGYATGGLVTGAGTTTSDSNMVALSNREYVVNAAAVARPGVKEQLDALNFGTGATAVVKPMVPLYSMAGSAGGHVTGGTSVVRLEFAPGGEGYFLSWLRNTIRVQGGGNVQTFLGS